MHQQQCSAYLWRTGCRWRTPRWTPAVASPAASGGWTKRMSQLNGVLGGQWECGTPGLRAGGGNVVPQGRRRAIPDRKCCTGSQQGGDVWKRRLAAAIHHLQLAGERLPRRHLMRQPWAGEVRLGRDGTEELLATGLPWCCRRQKWRRQTKSMGGSWESVGRTRDQSAAEWYGHMKVWSGGRTWQDPGTGEAHEEWQAGDTPGWRQLYPGGYECPWHPQCAPRIAGRLVRTHICLGWWLSHALPDESKPGGGAGGV